MELNVNSPAFSSEWIMKRTIMQTAPEKFF